ncbi:MAG: flagellar hook-associated protein FlgK [Lachnospiraceae bacterium]
MPSTFFGLNIAYTGLQAASASLNTTGNNIANVETKGYTRQETIQSAASALRTNTTYGMAGSGVETTEIKQIRNKYYDLKYWNNNSDLGNYNMKQYYMLQVQNYFTETDTVEGFGTIFSDMFSGLEEVYKNPGDNTKKDQFLSLAGNLTEYFNSMYTSLQKLQEDANSEIKNKVDEINSIASQLSVLNKQINTIEITGITANELRDQRALLIDQLSAVVDVEVTETPIYTTAGGNVESGTYKYSVTIAGGQSLVDGYEYNTLQCVAREEKVNQSDADGLYDIIWSNNLEFNLYGKNLGGELKGLVEFRDGNNEEYFHGTVSSVGTDASNPTVKTVSIPAGADYLKDLNKCTLSETGEITLGSKEFNYTGWEYDSSSQTYTFYLEPGEDPTQYVGKTAAVGKSVDYQGIPYYMSQMNEWVRQFSQTMNSIELKAQDSYGNPAEVLFTGTNIVDNDDPYTFSQYHSGTGTVTKSSDDSYYKLTAANFGVNVNMEADAGKFGTTTKISDGEDAQDIAEELLLVKTDKNKMTFRGCSSEEFLQCIISDVSLSTRSATTFYKNYTNISSAIKNQRLSVSGVDNDEEALSLVRFQEAYNLSSKMIQIMTEIYDRLILETGV